VTLVLTGSAAADPGPSEEWPTEGFSSTQDQLPIQDGRVWDQTVLISKQTFGAFTTTDTELHRWGSGLVLGVDGGRSKNGHVIAWVVTNAHVVRHGSTLSRLKVGFARPGANQARAWSPEVKVVEIVKERDLAFLRVAVPNQAEAHLLTLGAPECGSDTTTALLAIGWPNLRAREHWNVSPPPDHKALLRRFSRGYKVKVHNQYPFRAEARRLMERVSVVLHNADLLPGSSGGPLINTRGQVIGLNTRILYPGGPTTRYCCARADDHEPGRYCIHLAVSSHELVHEFERVSGLRIVEAGCPLHPPSSEQQAATQRAPSLLDRVLLQPWQIMPFLPQDPG
jgi:hypothetical protein